MPRTSRSPRQNRPRTYAVLFALVVALCLAQVTWWILFQVAETERLERASTLLAQGDTAAAAHELGAGRAGDLAATARRRRVMFVSEGITLSALVLVGVVFFYLAIVRERRLRLTQERFLTGATHELKTPVASLRLGLESMAAGTLPAAKHPAYLQAMLRETERLDLGLSNVLAAAGLQEAQSPAKLVRGDLAADVRDAVGALRLRASTAQVELALGDLPCTPVLRDESALQHALRNVLDNAIKFSPPQTAVRVGLHHAQTLATVTVEDSGVGVPTEDLPHLGERFYRAANALHKGGTGLGLYLARTLVRTCGGSLAVRSPGEGRGCCVEITLPREAT
ncbi:MAG: HAMP domain-containing sensor histidine kinase [Planctomycetota bacterium]